MKTKKKFFCLAQHLINGKVKVLEGTYFLSVEDAAYAAWMHATNMEEGGPEIRELLDNNNTMYGDYRYEVITEDEFKNDYPKLWKEFVG